MKKNILISLNLLLGGTSMFLAHDYYIASEGLRCITFVVLAWGNLFCAVTTQNAK